MTINRIETNKLNLDNVLGEIGTGRVQLPDFQRDWIWKDAQIKSLLASVSMGIPIGTLLTIEADDQLNHRPFAGTNLTETSSPRTLVLDGQQRLTALFQACQSGQPVTTKSKNNDAQRHYYFDIKKCIEETDREECVISENANQPKYSKPEEQYQDEIFPAQMMFNQRPWRDGYLEYHGQSESKRQLFYQFEDSVIRNFERYQIPEARMSSIELEVIAITFEKTNDRGTRLNAFDIITAKMTREGLNLREDWNRQKKALSAETVLKKIDETHYIKAITLLTTNTKQPSTRRKDMLKLNRTEYEQYSQDITKGFLSTAKLLRELGINKTGELVHIPQAIVMAAVYAQCSKKQTDTIQARKTIEQWYWITLLNESYGGRAADEQMPRDFLELTLQLTQGPLNRPPIYAERPFNADRLRSERQKSLTIAIQSLIKRKNDPLDWIKGTRIRMMAENTIEMHHIFPKKWCKDNNIDKGQTESVANLTLIDAETNRIIGGKAPSSYLKELQKRAGNISDTQMDKILESHLIPAKELRENDFKAFHEERTKRLKELIAGAIGPKMIR